MNKTEKNIDNLILLTGIALLALFSLTGCSKDSDNTPSCKECHITTRLISGASEFRTDTTITDCQDPTNYTREEPATWTNQDSTYTGTRKTSKRCK